MAINEKLQETPEVDAITVKGVSMHYPGGIHALDNIDLSIPSGKLTAFLGPSGCGKTTLLKIIAGLLEPAGGDIFVHGEKVTMPGPERALVFQDFALLPWATVLRNVAFGLELRGDNKKEREDIARKFIAEIGLTGFEDKYPHELSGGMRQRTGLARALVVNADILMMDEPFSAVDEQMRRKLQEDLRPVRVAAVGAPAGATKSTAVRGHRRKVHSQKVQELRPCEAGKVQEDLRPVRSVAASAAASEGRLRRLC